MDTEQILNTRDKLIAQYGPWWDNFQLKDDIWTVSPSRYPNPRLARLLQVVDALSKKPLNEQRILDLACASGHYAIEFALRGAQVIGVEGRVGSIKKAKFAQDVLGLQNLTFIREDVRNITSEKFGVFDVVICSGILYHLRDVEVAPFLETLYELASELVIIDTHIALAPHRKMTYKGSTYHGALTLEHFTHDSQVTKESRQRASIGNEVSFSLSRPSLVNMLSRTGFVAVFECLLPVVHNIDRCTFAAVKGSQTVVRTFGATTIPKSAWREDDLYYPRRSPSLAEVKWRLKHALATFGILSTFRRWRKAFNRLNLSGLSR